MIERWKDVIGYEGLYKISDYGNVKSLVYWNGTNKRIKKQSITTRGYCRIILYKKNKRKWIHTHRLVLETFIGPCPKEMQCRHLDGNPLNNKLSNLKWGTSSENTQDAIKHKTRFQPDNKGSKNGKSKLTDIRVMEIKHLLASGISQIQIAKRFHVDPSTICDINLGKTWRHIRWLT